MSGNDISSQNGPEVAVSEGEQLVTPKETQPNKMAELGSQVLGFLKQINLPSGRAIIRRVIWSVIIAIAGALGTALFSLIWQRVSPPIIDYEVDVRQESAKGAPMPDVDVDLGINGVASQKTNLFGKAVFSNLSSHLGHKKGTITLHKQGFRAYTVYGSSLGNNDSPVVAVMVTDMSSFPAPEVKEVNQPPKPDSATQTNPPSPSAPAQIVKTYSSGPQLSGVGAQDSPWYSLCSDPTPGYHVVNSDLNLTGDRTCNAWSECQPDTEKSTPTVSCWKFRMQGHSEALRPFGAGSAQAYSTGFLTVTLGKD
jgi:hypothetical protein